MLNIFRKTVFAACLVALSSGQLYASVANNNNAMGDESSEESHVTEPVVQNIQEPATDQGLLPMINEAALDNVTALQTQMDSMQSATADAAPAAIQHDEFLPGLPMDLKISIANRFLAQKLSPHYAWVCRSWCRFFLGSDNISEVKEKILPAIKFGHPLDWEPYLRQRLVEQDQRTFENSIFQYIPKDSPVIEVKLSTMLDRNGDYVLPAELDPHLCVTRRIETFVSPAVENTGKFLVLLLRLGQMKECAQQISANASFLENVAQADLSQNAVCALMRCGEYDLEKRGFRYTILTYKQMTGLSLWKLYVRKATLCAGTKVAWALSCSVRWPVYVYFLF